MALKHRQQNLGCPMVHLSYSLKRQLLCTLLYHVNIVDYIYLGYYMPPIREQHNTTPSHFETIDVNNYKNIFFSNTLSPPVLTKERRSGGPRGLYAAGPGGGMRI